MQQRINRFVHIIEYTLICQLIIFGMQLPILIAWGYPVQLLSFFGNILFTPLVFALIAVLSCIFMCFLCGIPNTTLFTLVTYILTAWKYVLATPINQWYLILPCPHWAFVCGIPLITGVIAYTTTTIRRNIIYLTCFFVIVGSGLKLYTPFGRNCYVHPNLTACDQTGNLALHYTPNTPNRRYTENWARFTLLPTLRRNFGRETIDAVISSHKRPHGLIRILYKMGILSQCYHSQTGQSAYKNDKHI